MGLGQWVLSCFSAVALSLLLKRGKTPTFLNRSFNIRVFMHLCTLGFWKCGLLMALGLG